MEGKENRAVEVEMASLSLLLRGLKRRKVILSLSWKYRALGDEVLSGILPDPDRLSSKRQWETRVQAVREKLRELAPEAPEVGCISSEAASSQGDARTLLGTVEEEDNENATPGMLEVDQLPAGFEFGEFLGSEYATGEATSLDDHWI